MQTHTNTLVSCPQAQVGGKKTSVILPKLQPDTAYSVTVAAVFPSGVVKDITGTGQTSKGLIPLPVFAGVRPSAVDDTVFGPSEPLGGVRNLQVLNPTMTTLNVRWEPAEGRVKEYKVLYVPAAGGPASMEEQVKPLPVGPPTRPVMCQSTSSMELRHSPVLLSLTSGMCV